MAKYTRQGTCEVWKSISATLRVTKVFLALFLRDAWANRVILHKRAVHGKRVMRLPIFVAALTLLAPMMLFASEESEADGPKVDEEDATTQSVYRGRILLKRNF